MSVPKLYSLSFVLYLLAVGGLRAQTANGTDGNGLPLTNPDSRHQALTPKMRVLRSNYKGPKSTVPNVHQNKNHAYSLVPTATPKRGPISLVHALTPIPTASPIVLRDAKGNPVTLWSPGKKIDLPSSTGPGGH